MFVESKVISLSYYNRAIRAINQPLRAQLEAPVSQMLYSLLLFFLIQILVTVGTITKNS